MLKINSSYGKWEIIKGFDVSLAEGIIDLHFSNIREGKNILKIDHKRQLSRVFYEEKSYVVKEFRKPGPWWIFRPDRISWKNSQKLILIKINVPQVYAWLRFYDGRGFIIMEDLGDNVVSYLLRNLNPESKMRIELIKRVAELAFHIHSKKIVYGDMKLTNIILKDSDLFLVDMDKIKIKRVMRLKDRAYNLRQIFLSFPKDITENELLLFLESYSQQYKAILLSLVLKGLQAPLK